MPTKPFIVTLLMSIAVISIFTATDLAFGSGTWTVSSPNGSLSVVVETKASGSEKSSLSYRVRSGSGEVLPSSPLGITLKRVGQFTDNLRFLGKSSRIIDERYVMPVGKRASA
jgi:hypothetical protein